MLTHLSGWLDRAVAHYNTGNDNEENDNDDSSGNNNNKSEADKAILSRRLIADMFPLATQVRFICFQAQEGVYRALHGINELPQDASKVVEEGRTLATAGDDDGENTAGEGLSNTIDDAKQCITKTIEFLDNVLSSTATTSSITTMTE